MPPPSTLRGLRTILKNRQLGKKWLNYLSPWTIYVCTVINPNKQFELFSCCQIAFRDFSGANFGNKALLIGLRLLVEHTVVQVK